MDISATFDAELESALGEYLSLKGNQKIKSQLLELASRASEILKSGGTLFFAGNGGSFADAQHMAAEFTGKMGRPRSPFSAIVLGANSSSMSAVGNDFGFEHVFAREFEALAGDHSLVIAFTTSGSSANIVELARKASELGKEFYCFTGNKPGEVGKFCDPIRVPSNRTERIQEMHTLLGHVFCYLTEEELGIFSS